MDRAQRGFTLIELLIVVAIIGILAAIAIPNFLAAQLRAQIARMETDMKALGDSLTMYQLDRNCYPPNYGSNPDRELRPLTTPIAYINTIPHDPFRRVGAKYQSTTPNYDYTSWNESIRNSSYRGEDCRKYWLLHGIGPDTYEDVWGGRITPNEPYGFTIALWNMSNGISSRGDIIHTSWAGLSF